MSAILRPCSFAWKTPTSEEYFADSYALCALHRRLAHAVTTDYGFHVTPALDLQICGLIRAAYAQWDQPTARPPVRNTMWLSIGRTGFAHAPIVMVTVAQQAKPNVELLALAVIFEKAGVNV